MKCINIKLLIVHLNKYSIGFSTGFSDHLVKLAHRVVVVDVNPSLSLINW